MNPITGQRIAAVAMAAAFALAAAQGARAQSGSLYGPPGVRPPLTLSGTSWFYQELPPPRQIQLHDLITVIVDEKSQVFSEGEVERRKRANIDAILLDWVRLDGLDLKPAAQLSGDPRIRGQINGQLRNEAELETRDGMKFRITARVTDIRPNGVLVIEAHRTITNNEEVWEYALIGEVDPEAVLPNKTVLSEKIANLDLRKREKGTVRDGYRRGWLMKFVDYVNPF